jgi:hypothetical protein
MLMREGTQMEHRWGERILLDLPARLDARPDLIAVCRLRNASLSGGYVETAAILPLGTRLHLELQWIHGKRAQDCRVAAYVVRSDENGLGLEWCEFAPGWIAVLICTHAPSSYGAITAQAPV